MKVFSLVSRLIMGVLFMFSGFVKAIDPLGSAYKFTDYFTAFGLDFLAPLSLALAIFLSAFELVLGLVLILGYQKKITYWVLLFFMSFFTLLTFILALTNPVHDCGCFGDALILTNWQTFFKNLVFMVFTLVLFSQRNQVRNPHALLPEVSLIVLFFAVSTVLSVSCLRHLPIIDFRPYSIGTDIREKMEMPDDAPQDEYLTLLFYENLSTGKVEEFTIDNYPDDTARYRFVTSESKLVSKGYEPPIHDFGIMDIYGDDITNELLGYKGYSLLMICYDIQKSELPVLAEAENWNSLAMLSEDFRFIPVTASVGPAIDEIMAENGLSYWFYSADEIMLKTVVRSNPGFVLLKNGTIVGKWAWRDFPSLGVWNADWPQLVEEYQNKFDEILHMYKDEGIMVENEISMVDFDKAANPVVTNSLDRKNRVAVWIIYGLILSVVILVLNLLPIKRD